ncbi:MAG TPA: hypothetical protein VFZ31_03950 [Vicinamibacterales bacterium]
MDTNTHNLHFSDLHGRAHVVRVLTADGHDWHLHTTIDGQSFSKHCHNWQAVERTLTWLRNHCHEPLTCDAAAPRNRSGVAASIAAALLLTLASTVASAQPVIYVSEPAIRFNAAVADYANMHRRLERLVGPITLNSTTESINRSMQALANAIRVERSHAQQGDLFTPALASELRGSVNQALLVHGFTAADVWESERADIVNPHAVRLRVNDTFPWLLASMMFPCVIEALPPLPSELQYRIVGSDLVLVDVHASLIVDILPGLLDDTEGMPRQEGGSR